MAQNVITLSNDRRELTITSAQGHRAVLQSARPGGFTAADVERAQDFNTNTNMVPNQVNRSWRCTVGKRDVLAQCNLGPPTWWRPRIELGRNKIMVGWLRALVAVSWADSV